MLQTNCYFYDILSLGDGKYSGKLYFDNQNDAYYVKPDDVIIDNKLDKYKILTWAGYPSNYVNDGVITFHYLTTDILPIGNSSQPTCSIYTPGELDIRTKLNTTGFIFNISSYNYTQNQFQISCSWDNYEQGLKSVIGDFISDQIGKLYKIIEFGTSDKWIDFIVEEIDKENKEPINGTGYLFKPTENFTLYFGGKLNDDQMINLGNRDNFLIDHYASMGGTGGAGIFILDVIPTSNGIVGMKTYKPDTVPVDVNLATAMSDTMNIRVVVGMNGDGDSYSPTAKINDIDVVLSESETKRWFIGYADINIITGSNYVLAKSSTGSTDSCLITLAGAGPNVLNVEFGPYPGTQTELKLNDTIDVTITTQIDATEIRILAGGASNAEVILPVNSGIATGSFVISNLSGNQSIQVIAKNSLGTDGETYTSSNLVLNQTVPVIGVIGVTYPSGKTAFGQDDSGSISSIVSNFDTIQYISSHFNIADPTVYNTTKSVVNTYSGYIGSGNNITITAVRTANNTTTSRTGLVHIATVPAIADITIAGNPARLVSSAIGVDYTIILTPNQTLAGPPQLTATIGTWQGSWTLVSNTWRRNLRIVDTDPKGTGFFTDLEMIGLSGILGTVINSGNSYIVGGFVSRLITFPPFSRVALIGTPVVNETKTAASIAGGNSLTRYTDTNIRENGYYIANEDGSYNPTGMYLGLSDSVFAGANTTGTLQANIQEEG